jgi:hypothetical protein
MEGTIVRRKANFFSVRILAAVLAAAVSLTILPASALAADTQKSAGQKLSQEDFNKAMRKLWEDHVTWTRLYIVSAVSNLPDKDATTQRLLQNQSDIGNAVASFYGNAAGEKLTGLLKDHILGAAALIEAAKSGDKAKINDASAKWYANGDQIADFLSSANPKAWPDADLRAGMKMHLDETAKEAIDRLQGKYTDEIQDYDHIHTHILGLADLLSNGIEKQFPDKFTKI